MSGQTDLTLHLGAHRTGTTALQLLLQRRSGRLAASGIAFLGPRTLRGDAFAGAQRGWRGALALGAARGPSPLAAECAREATAGRSRIVISEENLLGTMHVNLDAAELYPDAAARMAQLALALPAAPSRIFLTLRDFAGYWRSAHAHRIFARGEAAIDAGRLARSPGNAWLPVLRAVREAFPASRLTVARHRSAADFVPALAAAMVGAAALEGVPRPRTTVNASLPADVLAALRAMPQGAERVRAAEAVRREGRAPVDPFSAAQVRDLTARFEAEWAAIQAGAVPGVDVLTLPEAEAAR
ncbi:hypothetical protein [Albidovulum sp.]|uniref:hypothetical protein n=1 Tax=Albidovulum sp. TaxID=1872424 RepID=UPI0039B96691